MISLGLFALGIYIGAIVSYVMLKSKDMTAAAAATGMIGAAMSGAPVVFADSFVPDAMQPALAMYPLGLAVALMSVFLSAAQDNISQPGVAKKDRSGWRCTLGIAHAVGAALVYAIVAGVLFIPSVREGLAVLDQTFIAHGAAQPSENGGS